MNSPPHPTHLQAPAAVASTSAPTPAAGSSGTGARKSNAQLLFEFFEYLLSPSAKFDYPSPSSAFIDLVEANRRAGPRVAGRATFCRATLRLHARLMRDDAARAPPRRRHSWLIREAIFDGTSNFYEFLNDEIDACDPETPMDTDWTAKAIFAMEVRSGSPRPCGNVWLWRRVGPSVSETGWTPAQSGAAEAAAANARQSEAASSVAMWKPENMKWNSSVGILTRRCASRRAACSARPPGCRDPDANGASSHHAPPNPVLAPRERRQALESIRSRLSNPVLRDANPAF